MSCSILDYQRIKPRWEVLYHKVSITVTTSSEDRLILVATKKQKDRCVFSNCSVRFRKSGTSDFSTIGTRITD